MGYYIGLLVCDSISRSDGLVSKVLGTNGVFRPDKTIVKQIEPSFVRLAQLLLDPLSRYTDIRVYTGLDSESSRPVCEKKFGPESRYSGGCRVRSKIMSATGKTIFHPFYWSLSIDLTTWLEPKVSSYSKFNVLVDRHPMHCFSMALPHRHTISMVCADKYCES